jgi:hypothetical protein
VFMLMRRIIVLLTEEYNCVYYNEAYTILLTEEYNCFYVYETYNCVAD